MCPTPAPTEGRATKSHQASSVIVQQGGPGRPAPKVRVDMFLFMFNLNRQDILFVDLCV